MRARISRTVDLPFEAGKTYTTKQAVGERFAVSKITINKDNQVTGFWGVYETRPHLGVCPLGGDRLVADRKNIEEASDVFEVEFSKGKITFVDFSGERIDVLEMSLKERIGSGASLTLKLK